MQRDHTNESPSVVSSRVKWQKRRIIFMGVLLASLLAVVTWRFYDLQTQQVALQQKSERQSTGIVKMGTGGENDLDGHRGYILDTSGNELAMSVEAPSIYVHPRQVEDPKEAAKIIAETLSLPLDIVEKKLKSKKNFVWLARKTHPRLARALKQAKIPGLGVKMESKRYYPSQALAGQGGLAPRSASL